MIRTSPGKQLGEACSRERRAVRPPFVPFHGSYRITTNTAVHTVTLRVDNAADESHRNHLSYIKDLAPEMGRSVTLVYGVRF